MTDDVSDLVLEGNSAVTLLQELFACDITAQCEACGSIQGVGSLRRHGAPIGSSSKMFPLRWHSHAGGSYTSWPVARNERRALS
jgi:hypothetical protein